MPCGFAQGGSCENRNRLTGRGGSIGEPELSKAMNQKFGFTTGICLLVTCCASVAPAQAALSGYAKATQYLYVYNSGSPGVYSGQYARYSVGKLVLQEMSATSGVASPPAFDASGLAYFVDTAVVGFGLYQLPLMGSMGAAQLQFSGIPCYSSSVSTGPNGDFYVVQYCSTNVLEYTPKPAKKGKAKKPVAVYTGGNLGGASNALPTYAVVDHSGNLYVGDTGGGVTYFASGSTKPTIALAAGRSQAVTQMVVDSNLGRVPPEPIGGTPSSFSTRCWI